MKSLLCSAIPQLILVLCLRVVLVVLIGVRKTHATQWVYQDLRGKLGPIRAKWYKNGNPVQSKYFNRRAYGK